MPFDPSEDELARNWNLTPADLAVIAACRGADQRRRFALQLCMLRTHGRFLDDYRHAPIKIVNHLSRQLGCFVGVFGELHAAALPPPARVNLRLDHHTPAQLPGRLARVVGLIDDDSARRRHAVAPQNFLCLVFVDFHRARRFITATAGTPAPARTSPAGAACT